MATSGVVRALQYVQQSHVSRRSLQASVHLAKSYLQTTHRFGSLDTQDTYNGRIKVQLDYFSKEFPGVYYPNKSVQYEQPSTSLFARNRDSTMKNILKMAKMNENTHIIIDQSRSLTTPFSEGRVKSIACLPAAITICGDAPCANLILFL